jgi:hypothetical protein
MRCLHFAKPLPLLLATTIVSLACTCLTATAGEPLFPNADFEAGTLDGWKAAGKAFRFQPTEGDNPRARGR